MKTLTRSKAKDLAIDHKTVCGKEMELSECKDAATDPRERFDQDITS